MKWLEETAPGGAGLVVQRSAHWGYNAIGVVSGDEAVAVDPGLTPDELASFRAALEDGGRRVVAVILTHAHHDHIRGWNAFGDARVVAPRVAAEKPEESRVRILAGKSKFDRRLGVDDAGFRFPEVDEVFDDRCVVRCGDLELVCVFLPGHSNCTSVVAVPKLGALLTADYLVKPGLPYCRWEARAFETAHERMRALLDEFGIERAIPAHNRFLEGRAAVEGAIATELDYFADLRAEVARRLAEGQGEDAIVRGVGAWLTERRGVDLGLVARQDHDNTRRVLRESGI